MLVEFWGSTTYGVDDAMRNVLVLQEEFGPDLAVLFVEGRRLDPDRVHALALERRWLGTPAMWTSEYVFKTGAARMPNFVLLSGEGEVLLKGATGQMEIHYGQRLMEELEDRVRAEIELRRSGPPDAPSAVRELYRDFHRGRIGRALSRARDLAAEAPGSDEGRAAAEAAAVFEERLERRLARAEWLLGDGRIGRAEEELAGLERELAPGSPPEVHYRRLADSLAADELDGERRADKALAALEKKLYARGTGPGTAKSLQRLARKYAGTRSAARAERLAGLLEGS